MMLEQPNLNDDDESLSSSAEEELRLLPSVEERDEVKEIQRESQSDTDRVRTWRFLVRVTIAMTALGVSLLSFAFLEIENRNDFVYAFDETFDFISHGMEKHADALQHSFSSMAAIMAVQGFPSSSSTTAATSRTTWPFVTVPFFEASARNVRVESQIEKLLVAHRVTNAQMLEYQEYVSARYEGWVQESHAAFSTEDNNTTAAFSTTGYDAFFKQKTVDGQYQLDDIARPEYFPVWQSSPPPADYSLINWNLGSDESLAPVLEASLKKTRDRMVYSDTFYDSSSAAERSGSIAHYPRCFVSKAIFPDIGKPGSAPVAVLVGELAWHRVLQDLNVTGISSILHSNCHDQQAVFTYELNASGVAFVGKGSLHELRYTSMERQINLFDSTAFNFSESPLGHCLYRMSIFPTPEFEERFRSDTPRVFASVVAGAFLAMAAIFMIYDFFVQRRNDKLIESAAKSNAIVSSMFPGAMRERLIENQANVSSPKGLANFLMNKNVNDDSLDSSKKTKPMADIFLETSVCFADIVGFTAWASTREPSQVFTLLETVFSAFDSIAQELRVFKVETVGDCYVAVIGLPTPRKDHAIAMARFARRILNKFNKLVNKLEVTLGPDTGDLGLRIGIHSGVVTAGVLRGERARFQLFGDTMNTASRIESTGQGNRIHLSQETADLICKGGKSHWLEIREDKVNAKGKGDLQTYWLTSSGAMTSGSTQSTSSFGSSEECVTPLRLERTSRLIEWNVETFLRLLRQVVSRREACSSSSHRTKGNETPVPLDDSLVTLSDKPLDEVKEIIELPEFDQATANRQKPPEKVKIDEEVVKELRDMITSIAALYRENSFHNFEHASHVTMSVIKLLSRIVAPTDIDFESKNGESKYDYVAATLHDHTYGITSDPLTQFACAWSALIHDVDHTGVPNATLVSEGAAIASVYQNRSVAEQNSLVLSWMLLMDEKFSKLRSTICGTPEELRRFRELLVNGVLATDIADKELKNLRNARWDKAFSTNIVSSVMEQNPSAEDPRVATNRKATIVIEHLIQASDVAHTMQHWHVYRKWNEMLFAETYAAYKAGRADTDPAQNWYKGELGFFDYYIIPLAKKLKDCGVFGKSSDEYLTYALENRKEWEQRGQQIVEEMSEKIKQQT